jgi:flagellar capping protein FliD
VKSLNYKQLNNDILSSIEAYVEKFNAYFIDLNARFNYTDYFNVSPASFDIFKNEINKHLRGYMEEGLEFNKKMDGISTDDKEIEETLFFYPLIGAISNLITPLSQLSPINK